MMSGTMPSSSQANRSPVRAKPVCTSSAMKTMPFARQNSAIRGRKPRGRLDEAALAGDRLDHHGGDVLRADLLVIMSMACAAASSAQFSGPVGQRNG